MKNKNLVKIKFPYCTAAFTVLLLLYDRSAYTVITLASALLHEAGHIIAAGACRVGISEITLYPFGADIKLEDPLRSYGKDIIISAAGAFFNLVSALVFYLFFHGAISRWVISCNLTLAITNLIPIDGLDGGGILRAVICRFSDGGRADSVIRVSSFFGLFVMWFLSVYIFFVNDGNPSLFIIACALFVSVFLRADSRGKSEDY